MYFSFLPLLVWVLIEPMRWKIDITAYNRYAMPVESIGYCYSPHAVYFVVGLGVFGAFSMAHAYAVSYETRLDEDVNRVCIITRMYSFINDFNRRVKRSSLLW